MAIYHFNQKILQRSQGDSAFSAFAYQARERIANEMDGTISDYTKKDPVIFSYFALPDEADKNIFKSELDLIREMEISEANKNAQVGVYGDVALPIELSQEEHEALMKKFAQEFTQKGQAIIINQHGGHGNDNPHFHFIATIRPFEKEGQSLSNKNKSYKVYEVANGTEIQFYNAEELKEKNELIKKENESLPDGEKKAEYEKIFKYRINKKVEQMTQSQAKEKGLHPTKDRTSRYPVSETVYYNDFLSKDMLIDRRNAWENIVNDGLKKRGMEQRVSAKSYKELGIDRIPMQHLGSKRHNMEQKGLEVDASLFNKSIQFINNLKAQAQTILVKLQIRTEERALNKSINYLENKTYLKSTNPDQEKEKALEFKANIEIKLESLKQCLEHLNRLTGKIDMEEPQTSLETHRKGSQLERMKGMKRKEEIDMSLTHRELVSQLVNTENEIYQITKQLEGNVKDFSPNQRMEVERARKELIANYNATINTIPISQRSFILQEVQGKVDTVLKEDKGFEAKKARTHLRSVRRDSLSQTRDISITYER